MLNIKFILRVIYMKKHNEHLDSFIKNIYFNTGISHGELAASLGTSPNSLSGRIRRYQTIEPPIFRRERVGKRYLYSLTEHGKIYYEQEVSKRMEEARMRIEKAEHFLRKEEKISNILENCDLANNHSDECNISLLKKVDIDTISKTFSFNEFKFLALTFGLLGEDMTTRNAFSYTVPDMELKEQWGWAENVLNKYKQMILTNLDKDVIERHIPTHSIEKSIFFRSYNK